MKSKLFIENNTIKDISDLLFKRFKNNILLESSRKKHNQSINAYSFNDVSNYVDIYSNLNHNMPLFQFSTNFHVRHPLKGGLTFAIFWGSPHGYLCQGGGCG